MSKSRTKVISTKWVLGGGRPCKDWATILSQSASTTQQQHLVDQEVKTQETALASRAVYQWSATDLELMYHFMSHVDFAQDDRVLWQERVPHLAFRHHSILHVLLAVAALHLARLEPDRAEALVRLADDHLASGVRQATVLSSHLSRDNCGIYYLTACLICCCGFAKKPSPGNLLVVADGCEVPWLDLFRGVRIIIETFGMATIFTGELSNLPAPTPASDVLPSAESQSPKFITWEGPLRKILELMTCASSEEQEVYTRTHRMLTWCFQETYGTPSSPKPPVGKLEVVMVWLYAMEDEFVSYVRSRRPLALVMLAYYAVLLQTLEVVWFLRGWPAHLCREIQGFLCPPYDQWVQWPSDQIFPA